MYNILRPVWNTQENVHVTVRVNYNCVNSAATTFSGCIWWTIGKIGKRRKV